MRELPMEIMSRTEHGTSQRAVLYQHKGKDLVCVLYNESFWEAGRKLFIRVNHFAHPDQCDCCGLQPHCDELFGEAGDSCRIYEDMCRWAPVSEDQIFILEALFNDRT